jgi:hypothetical protein
MLLVSHKFQNMYTHIYLCCKSRILVPDDGPRVPKHVAFTNDVRWMCLTVTNMPVLMAQHNGINSIKIYLLPLALRPRMELTSFWLDFKHPTFPNYQHVRTKMRFIFLAIVSQSSNSVVHQRLPLSALHKTLTDDGDHFVILSSSNIQRTHVTGKNTRKWLGALREGSWLLLNDTSYP